MINLDNIFYLYTNMDRNSKFLLTMIILIILLLILIVIISLISRKKEVQNVNKVIKTNINKTKINYDEDEKNVDLTPTIKLNNEENTSTIDIIEDEDIEIIEVIEDEEDEIDNIKKLIENTLEQEPIKLNEFEQEQEDNAIISYDELVKRAGAKKIVYKTKKEEKKVDNKKESTVFRPSRIVSPIYGIQKEENEKDEVLESFKELEQVKSNLISPSSDEMIKDIEFLNNLKKFRSELD